MRVTQSPSAAETLIVDAAIPNITPNTLFDYWTRPSLLQKWWPAVAELQPTVGGSYHFSWPEMGWHLRGRYLTYEYGRRLAFTWKWDHDEPSEPERVVTVDFAPLPSASARLRLTHGPYAATPEDQTIRLEHHLAGWLHFLPRLAMAIDAN
jgi:uncharacterized protein YndB with AHSA1/START domain